MKARLAGLLLAAAACVPTLALAQDAAAPGRESDITELADGVWLLPGRVERGRQPDGNSLLLQGRDGLVVVDTGRHIEHVQALRLWMRARRQALSGVINTHWHLDHVGGNSALRRQVPRLRTWGSAALRDAVRDQMPKSQEALRQSLLQPQVDVDAHRMASVDLSLYGDMKSFVPDELIEGPAQDLEIAGRALRVGVERGPTQGDVWVLDRASGVLAVGDFVTLPVPFFDTACPSAWQASLGRLQGLPFQRAVPGHGPVMSRDELARYGRAFDQLLACAAGSDPVGACAAGWINDLGPLLPKASQPAVLPMLTHYFDTLLRAAPAERQRHCSAG